MVGQAPWKLFKELYLYVPYLRLTNAIGKVGIVLY